MWHFAVAERSRNGMREGSDREPPQVGTVSRVTRLMALAIRFEGLIRDGIVTDYAELARLGHVTRARMWQIMSLLQLTPDIQEELLFLPPVTSGKDPITERDLRPIVAELDWREQWRLWDAMR
jgi:hypothetical protein